MEVEYSNLTAADGLKTMIELLNKGETSTFEGGKRFIGRQGSGLVLDGLLGYEIKQTGEGYYDMVEINETDEYGVPISSFVKGKPRYVREDFEQVPVLNFSDTLEDFYKKPILTEDESSLYYTPNIFKMNEQKSSDSVSHLTCLWVDIDDVTVETAEQRLAASDLPKPNVAVSSGRGVHYYWVFSVSVKANQYASARAWKYRKSYLSTWQNLIRYYATELGGDLKATDPGRYLRIPGSYNPKAGKKAEIIYINRDSTYGILDLNNDYLAKRDRAVQAVKDGTATFESLYKPWQYLIKLESTESAETGRTTRTNRTRFEKVPGVRYGYDNYHHLMRQDLIRLAEIRGGIKKGHRFNYLTTLRQFGAPDGQLHEINRELVKPAYNEREMHYVLTKKMNYRSENAKPKRNTIVEWLDITPDEEYGMTVLMNEMTGTIKKQMRELEAMTKRIEYLYEQQLKRIVIHGLTGKKWTIAKKAELLGMTERSINRIIQEDGEYEPTIAEKLEARKGEQILTTNRGAFKVKEEINTRELLVKTLLENVELSMRIINMVITHDNLSDEAINDYMTAAVKINNVLQKIYNTMTDDPVFKDSKVRVRAVEKQVRQFQQVMAS